MQGNQGGEPGGQEALRQKERAFTGCHRDNGREGCISLQPRQKTLSPEGRGGGGGGRERDERLMSQRTCMLVPWDGW